MRKLPIVQASESGFPELDRRWLSVALDAPLPVETRATCDTCVMLPDASRETSDLDIAFNANTKCCTIVPHVESFRIGAILESDLPGRDIIDKRIDDRGGVTPLGIGASKAQKEADDRMRAAGAFGQDLDARCPYYIEDGGLCGIWHHRNSSCATYHCRFVRGRFGAAVWRSIQNMLGAAERALSRWCLLAVDFDDDALAVLFPPKSGVVPGVPRSDPQADGVYEQVWGSWLGRERELYAECHKRVSDLNWHDVLGIAGPEVAVLARAARVALKRWHDQTLPDKLKVGPHRANQSAMMNLRVRGYSGLDTVDFPMQVVATMQLFDGRPIAEIREEAKLNFGASIDDDTLMSLYELGVLDEA